MLGYITRDACVLFVLLWNVSVNFGKETNILNHPPEEGLETKYFSHIDDVTPLGSQN